MFYLSDWYVKKEYSSEPCKVLWSDKFNSILRRIENFSDKHPSTLYLCNKVQEILIYFFHKFKIVWEKRNHMIRISDKELYKALYPIILDDITKLSDRSLIYYMSLLEKYGEKELNTWGFEERPPKKVGFLKKLWYNITFKVYDNYQEQKK